MYSKASDVCERKPGGIRSESLMLLVRKTAVTCWDNAEAFRRLVWRQDSGKASALLRLKTLRLSQNVFQIIFL
jgi:hypothetical protein